MYKRQEWEKGLHTLLDALPGLRRRFPGTRLVVAGRGTYEQDLRERAARLRLDGAVTFAGFLGPDLAGTMAATDAMAVPSIYEPFGMVALEAAAAGAPLAVAATGGLAEIVQPGVTGVVFPAKDTTALADAVSTLVSDRDGARQMAGRARQMVAGRYGWSSIAGRTVAAYAGAIDSTPEHTALTRARLAAGRPDLVVPEGNLLARQDAMT